MCFGMIVVCFFSSLQKKTVPKYHIIWVFCFLIISGFEYFPGCLQNEFFLSQMCAGGLRLEEGCWLAGPPGWGARQLKRCPGQEALEGGRPLPPGGVELPTMQLNECKIWDPTLCENTAIHLKTGIVVEDEEEAQVRQKELILCCSESLLKHQKNVCGQKPKCAKEVENATLDFLSPIDEFYC